LQPKSLALCGRRQVQNGTQPASRADPGNVRFGSLADIAAGQRDVRFTPNSGHGALLVQTRLRDSISIPFAKKTVGPNGSAERCVESECFACVQIDLSRSAN
jgi:hypothetical protein